MDNISLITNHADEAAERLIDWFSGGSFEDLTKLLAGRYQDLEDVAFPIISNKYLANASGVTLDNIGALVGISRILGQSDDDYRVLIYAKIAANTSNGTIPDIYNIMSILGATNIRVFDVYPASIELQYTASNIISECDCIRRILEGVDNSDGGSTAPILIGISVDNSENGVPFGFAGTVGAGGYGVGSISGAG